MIKFMANSCMIFALAFSSIVCANNEVKQIKIEVSLNIFTLNEDASETTISDILQQQNIKDPSLYYAHAGESALLDIRKNDHNKDDKFTINIKVNDSATKYDINFQLDNDSKTSIPGISSYSVGDDLVFTAKINGASKLIKVMTKVVDENDANQLAMNILNITRKLHLKNTSQQYFEEDNFWKSDARRFRKMSKNITTPQGHFFYLTNTDQNRAIKGAIEFNTPLNLETKTTEYNVGIRNFGLKDDQLTFVVLPGKTVLIGRWFSSVNLSIKAASFLSNEEVENLKAAAK